MGACAPGADDHADHDLGTPVALLDQLVIEPPGIVTTLGPAVCEIPQIRGQLGQPGPAGRIDRGLVRRHILAHGPAIQPQGVGDLPEGPPDIPMPLHSLPARALPGGGLRGVRRSIRGAHRQGHEGRRQRLRGEAGAGLVPLARV